MTQMILLMAYLMKNGMSYQMMKISHYIVDFKLPGRQVHHLSQLLQQLVLQPINLLQMIILEKAEQVGERILVGVILE